MRTLILSGLYTVVIKLEADNCMKSLYAVSFHQQGLKLIPGFQCPCSETVNVKVHGDTVCQGRCGRSCVSSYKTLSSIPLNTFRMKCNAVCTAGLLNIHQGLMSIMHLWLNEQIPQNYSLISSRKPFRGVEVIIRANA